jgi:alkylation response protein AidB-like acyl-CoA dehydrogenase
LLLESRSDDLLVSGVADGTIRTVIAHGSLSRGGGVVARHVEAASAATHLLVVDDVAGVIGWVDLAGADVRELPGLPRPAWSEVRTVDGPEWTEPLASHPDLLRVRRLSLAARATAAVSRSHEMALDHAKRREQFGKVIGSFQAVSHRLVDAQIDLTAARELLAHALELRAVGDPSWRLASEIYIEFVSERLAGIQFAAHHTLAAIGYFEESGAPWLFRRAHTDLATLSAIARDGSVGEYLVDRGHRLPDYDRGPRAEAIRAEVLEAFAPWLSGPPSRLHVWDDAARAVFKEHGWIGVGWPSEVGGGGWPVGDVMAFSEVLAYANPPLGNILMGINSVAPMVLNVGTPELQELVLSEIQKGDLSIALGYSEPEAGSDLASLRTKAHRVDGGWLINGQKMWGTCFPDSRWVVVAARTNQQATPPHAGISLFLVDTDSPRITVSPHTSLAGDVSATTFWDDVFVPDGRLIGEVDAGWAALMGALAGERVLIGASVMRAHRAFDRLVDLVAGSPDTVVPNQRADYRRQIGRVAVRLQAARALVNIAVRAMTDGVSSRTAPPMAKIAATELAEDLNATAIAILGPDALYEWGVDGALGDGYFDDGLRASIMGVIAGGTGDIQRNLIARGLGLPK